MSNIQKQQIQEYRNSKYQIDESTGACQLQPEIRKDLDNSVNILSEQLYSKEVHFVFELIQNAEDNHYAEGIQPSLHFALLDDDPTQTSGCEGCLAIFNNEKGFAFENIKAISSVGSSTKATSKDSGYIGEKGIGFKSVFAVSPAPHIFSNGYQFSFKDKDEKTGLGYIIPYWVENVPDFVSKTLVEHTTCILLPLKADNGGIARARIERELTHLDSSILLFLNKLTSISVSVGEQNTRYHKSQKANQAFLTVSNKKGENTKRYLVAKRKVNVPDSMEEEKRAKVKKRDITLAFPYEANPEHKLYAYLPTELHTGLPFLVNADFLLPASRESVLVDKAWNQWMRDEISVFAYDTLAELLTQQNSTEAIKWIPVLEECRDDFLLKVFEETIQKLKLLAFVPCVGGERREPQNCCFSDIKIAGLLAEVADEEASPICFVAGSDAHEYIKQLEPMFGGCFDLSILKGYMETSLKGMECKGAPWFLKIYQWLQRNDQGLLNERTADTLLASPLILSSSGIKKRKDGHVFETASANIIYPILDADESSSVFELVDTKLHSLLSKDKSLHEFFREKFKVKKLSQTEYLKEVAFPFFEKHCEDIPDAQAWNLNEFVFQNWFSLSDEIKEMLPSSLPVKLEDGIFWLDPNLTLIRATPRCYKSSSIWINLFSSNEQEGLAVLSDDYLALANKYKNVKEDEIFSALLASASPLLPTTQVVKKRRYRGFWDLDRGLNKNYVSYLDEYFTQIDSIDDIEGSVTRAPDSVRDSSLLVDESVRSSLMSWIISRQKIESSEDYSGPYWDAVKLSYREPYAWKREKTLQSELAFYLMEQSWLPTNNGLKRPGEVFFRTSQIQQTYGDALNYLTEDVPRDVAELLGISADVSADRIVDTLRSWSNSNEKRSIQHMLVIYQQLSGQGVDLKELFNNEHLIYCPSGNRNWCTAGQAVWRSQQSILGDVFHWLDDYYPEDRQPFWVDTIGVQSKPSAEHFANAWLRLQASDDPDPRDSMYSIYNSLLGYLRSTGLEELDPWFEEFAAEAKCLTQEYTNPGGKKERCWMNADEIFASDIHEKLRPLLSEAGARFMWISRGKDHDDFELLYEALEIRRASECLKTSIDISHKHAICPSSELLTNPSRSLISCIRKKNNSVADSEWLEGEELRAILTCKEMVLREPIQVDYWLDYYQASSATNVYFDQSSLTLFYLEQDDDPDLMRESVSSELALKLFKREYRRYEDTILRVLGANDKKALRIIKDKGWERLLTKDEVNQIEHLIASAGESPIKSEQSDTDTDVSEQSAASDQTAGQDDTTSRQQTQEDRSESGERDEAANDGRAVDPASDVSGSQQAGEAGQEANGSDSDASSVYGNGANADTEPAAASGNRDQFRSGEKKSSNGSEDNCTNHNDARDSSGSRQRNTDGGARQEGEQPNRSGSRTKSSNQQSEPRDFSEGYRMLSYVSSDSVEGEASDVGEQQTCQQKQTGDKAEQLVAKHLADMGYEVNHLGGNNPGYDIEAMDPETGELFYVEVKGIRGNWNATGVGISDVQFNTCLEKGDNFWLYVVERLSFQPILHKIVNPAVLIKAFYFDRNWHEIADTSSITTGHLKTDFSVQELLDEDCFIVFLEVAKRALPEPEIGFDLQDLSGEIIGNLELAWPRLKIGIYLDEEPIDISGWLLISAREVLADLDWLNCIEDKEHEAH